MKLRSILCGMLAFAAVVGCKEELPLEPKLNVSRTAAEVAAEGASITVEVTSNTTWNAEANQDWISSITPSQGTASEEPVTVTIKAEENEETDGRTAVITFTAGPVEKTMVISQLGKRSEEPSDDPVSGTDSDLFVAWTSSPLLKDINRDTTNPNCFYQAANDTAEGYGNGVLTSILGTGSIKYWSINKSGFSTDQMRRHIGNDGEPMAYGVWTGDHFLFEAEYNLPEKSNVSISFGMRGKKTTLKYWLLEYKDGTAWKPAGETETLGDVVYNVVCGTDEAPATINASVVMANATDKVQFRLVCAAPISIEGKTLEQPANNSYVRNSICRLAIAAKQIGALLCIENLPRTCPGRTAEEIEYLTADIPNVAVCFDTNHLLLGSHKDFLKKVGDRIRTLHVSDYDGVDEKHWLPMHEKTIIDWTTFYKDLKKTGYKGVFMFEVTKKHGTPNDLVKIYKTLKKF